MKIFKQAQSIADLRSRYSSLVTTG
jgi:hypothetical protein